jgi:hypothetical protein
VLRRLPGWRAEIKALPVAACGPRAFSIITLNNRILSPSAQLFSSLPASSPSRCGHDVGFDADQYGIVALC